LALSCPATLLTKTSGVSLSVETLLRGEFGGGHVATVWDLRLDIDVGLDGRDKSEKVS
jgi:hypothetical protein